MIDIVHESRLINSFVLCPVDRGQVMAHKLGQYLTFSFETPGPPPLKRIYSISAAPNGETYRISVTRKTRASRHP